MQRITDFTNLYQRQITLRFGLKPMFETQEFITRAQIVENDERRAEEYKEVKSILDEYHRGFIDSALNGFAQKFYTHNDEDRDTIEKWKSSLDNLWDCYLNDNTSKRSANLEAYRSALRELIVDSFKNDPRYSRLDKKELIKKDVPLFLKDDDVKKKIVSHFNDFTMYFIGYNQNRMNMYSAEAKASAIGFRLINQNLMRFMDNLIALKNKILPHLDESVIIQLNKDFEPALNTHSILDMFELDYYHEMLTQRQIAVYNAVIGGRVDEGNKTEIKGLNQYINEFAGEVKLPLLLPLYNQILSERVAVSFRDEQFKDAKEVTSNIDAAFHSLKSDVLVQTERILDSLENYDLDGIFISNDADLAIVSQRHYGTFDAVKNALIAEFDQIHPPKPRQTREKRENDIKKYLKTIDSVSLGKIDSLLQERSGKSIVEYFKTKGAINNEDLFLQRENLFSLIDNRYASIQEVLHSASPSDELLRKSIETIKDFLDAIKDLQRFIKPLCGSGNESQKDELFYGEFSVLYTQLDETITPLYNKVRNYLTRKPYNVDKFKLNFESPSLLKGWPKKDEYSCALFRKDDNNYYLAILDSNHRQCLNNLVAPTSLDDSIEMMKYLQGGKMGHNIQNLMVVDGEVKKVNGLKEKTGPFAGQNLRLEQAKNDYLPDDINRIRKSKSYSISSPSFSRADLNRFISFYMPLAREYYSDYDFKLKEPHEYDSFADFTDHINGQAYQLQLQPYSWERLRTLVSSGQVYLFKLISKDFSPFAKGRPNLHTIYWRMLFDQRNLQDVVYKLNGEAEIFFRRKSIENPVVHSANVSIQNKSEYNKINKPHSRFEYDIIKDRRYTIDHYEFHVPITLNFKAPSKVDLNHSVLNFIKGKGIRHIIGIDRGERHLLYLSVIDLDGNIVKQMSLNSIASNPNAPGFEQDYNSLLANREGDRLQARRNWTLLDNIKDLKTGYLSQIVHLIYKMMIEYDAIVVLENLNQGFIRNRGGKVEKSVYQKFEKMLIDKLGYVVDKTLAPTEPCGALRALQLSESYESFNKTQQKKSVRQCGFIFYVPAWNTSKIDPVTGFVNLFDTRWSKKEEIKAFFSKFEKIEYNAKQDSFEFTFDYKKFGKGDGTRTIWTLSSMGERIYTYRSKQQSGQYISEVVMPTALIKDIFNKAGIPVEGNLKDGISRIDNATWLKDLLQAFKFIIQMRNSKVNSDVDYLLSPALDNNGKIFDSRFNDASMPNNADANGAYNIARKGLMLVHQIMESLDLDNLKYDLSNKAWLQFAQNFKWKN